MNTSKGDASLYEDYDDDVDDVEPEQKTITVRVTVRHLAGVSSSHSHYVFCQVLYFIIYTTEPKIRLRL